MAMSRVEFLFDYASPHAFLASVSLGAKLPNAEIEYRPVYLRGFESFSKGIPFSAPRIAYMMVDLQRCAADCGVEIRMPAAFPVNGLYALRGAIAAQRAGKLAVYHDVMFQAVWQRGRDISQKETVAAIAAELGLPEVAGALDDPSIKEELRKSTEAAAKRGVFGVPTFFVGAEMFWGHDRMHHVARALERATAGAASS
jgi:2-hydroxychromene-2-carboxylate isomerase